MKKMDTAKPSNFENKEHPARTSNERFKVYNQPVFPGNPAAAAEIQPGRELHAAALQAPLRPEFHRRVSRPAGSHGRGSGGHAHQRETRTQAPGRRKKDTRSHQAPRITQTRAKATKEEASPTKRAISESLEEEPWHGAPGPCVAGFARHQSPPMAATHGSGAPCHNQLLHHDLNLQAQR